MHGIGRSLWHRARSARRLSARAVMLALTVGSGCMGSAGERDTAMVGLASGTREARATTECRLTGPWQPCSVRDRLERAGLAPQLSDTIQHGFLRVPGEVYLLGRSELQVFLYPDSDSRAADIALLDSARAAPAGAAVQWPTRPTLITSNNLAAILLSDSERHIERVRNALTAGLPAP